MQNDALPPNQRQPAPVKPQPIRPASGGLQEALDSSDSETTRPEARLICIRLRLGKDNIADGHGHYWPMGGCDVTGQGQ